MAGGWRLGAAAPYLGLGLGLGRDPPVSSSMRAPLWGGRGPA